MGQGTANRLGVADMSLGLHARLGELGWLSDERSRFLSDQAARVVTSAHGRKTTISPHDMRGVLRARTDQGGEITGFDILRPGRTLREFGMLATHGFTRKDRNMAFRETQILRVGKALEQTEEGQLFDPGTRARALLRKLDRLAQAPTPEADRLRAQLLDTGPKAAEAAQLAAVMERVLSAEWNRPLEHQLATLRAFDREPLPTWYAEEFFSHRHRIDPTDTELAQALNQLRIGDHDIAEILTAFARPAIDSDSAVPTDARRHAASGREEVYAAMPVRAEQVTDTTSAEFTEAVDELAGQLDGNQRPSWLPAAIRYLVQHDLTEEVPTADELAAIIAERIGIPVADLLPAQFDHELRRLAEEAAREPGPDSPTRVQFGYLAEQGLEARPVPADGDGPFAAVTQTVPQPVLHDRIVRAAWQWGISVSAEGVGRYLGQLAERARASPPAGLVTGGHLRLFLAEQVERGPGGWPRGRFFAADGSAASDSGQPVLTRLGLAAALRGLTGYGGGLRPAIPRADRLLPQLAAPGSRRGRHPGTPAPAGCCRARALHHRAARAPLLRDPPAGVRGCWGIWSGGVGPGRGRGGAGGGRAGAGCGVRGRGWC